MTPRLAAVVLLVLATSACADGRAEVRTIRTTLYVDGSPARAFADIAPDDGSDVTTTHVLDGRTARWFDGSAWHDGDSKPQVRCPGAGPDHAVELGYVQTEPTDDASGDTLIAFVRCL